MNRIRLLLVSAIGIAALGLPTVALAARPVVTHDVAHFTGGRLVTADGTLDFSLSFSTLSGPRGHLGYRGTAGEFIGVEGYAEMHGSLLTGEYFLIDVASGEPAGWATYRVTFTPAGPEVATHRATRQGNVRTLLDFLEQPMAATGAITMPDGTTFDFEGLDASRFVADLWSNDPKATILDGSETFVEATWIVDGQPVVFRANVTELDATSVVFVQPEFGEILGIARPSLVDGRLTGTYTLTDSDRVERGSASVDVSLIEGATRASFERTEISFQRVLTTPVAVQGSLVLTLDGVVHVLDFAEADVTASRQSWHGIQYPNAEGGEG